MARARRRGSRLVLKITLERVEPPVWRRFVVARMIWLADLHDVIQAVMGWQQCHMHEFEIGGVRYGEIDPHHDPEYAAMIEDEFDARLGDLLTGPKSEFRYVYDLGDNWKHRIVVEGEADAHEFKRIPVCIEGERACPPEDSGGAFGYREFLEAIADPEHEEHENMLGWIGGEFDPEAFDVAAANKELRRVRYD